MNATDTPIVQAAADMGGQQPPAPPAEPQATPQPPPRAAFDPHGAVTGAFDPRRKSPILACILSLVPGLGQIYIGYYKLGFVHNFVFAGTIMLMVMTDGEIAPLAGPFLGFFYVYNIVDAGRRAALFNHSLAGMEGVTPPTDISLPLPGGSIAGGLILIVAGGVLLSNTLLGIPWYWLEEWWPVAPIAFGVWLFWKGIREKVQS